MRMRTHNKNSDKPHFGYKLYSIIDRNYQQIRRFKTTTVTFHDCQVDLSEKNGVVYRDRGSFRAKSQGYDATTKRAVKENPLE